MSKATFPFIQWNTIRVKLALGMAVFLLPVCIYLLFDNIYSRHIFQATAAQENQKSLTLYMQNLDAKLTDASAYMAEIISSDSSLQQMQFDQDQNQREIAKASAFRDFTEAAPRYSAVDGFFVYSAVTGDYFTTFASSGSTYELERDIETFVKQQAIRNAAIGTGYFTEKIEGRYLIFRIFKQDQLYIGGWSAADDLVVQINSINAKDSAVDLLVTDDGKAMNNADFVAKHKIHLREDFSRYYISGGYVVIGRKSTAGDFWLVTLIPEKKLMGNLLQLQFVGYGIILLVLLLIPVFVLYTKKVVLDPIKTITATIRHVNGGFLKSRIPAFQSSVEFIEIRDAFNKLMDEIVDLKISVYEEKISKQKEEMENLYLQLNPHFILNSLHIMYSLAELKNYRLVQEMSLCLSKYFGYITRNGKNLVKLDEEIDQLRNYIRIQEMRFPGFFTYEIQVEKELRDVPVPSLILQTFVENIFKYALNMDNSIHFSVMVAGEGERRMRITVSDTGKWFEAGILEQLRAGKRITKEDGEHIGIWNLKRRLELIYGTRARMVFRNVEPIGVEVTILLPF